MNWLLVFVGGGLGSWARYGLALLLTRWNAFPVATLLANVLACFIIGVLTGLATRGDLSSQQRLLFATGFCGGFSTFSTFSNETIALFHGGEAFLAAVNVVASLVLCFGATFGGILLVRHGAI